MATSRLRRTLFSKEASAAEGAENNKRNNQDKLTIIILQVNLDMMDSMGPGKLVRHMQNPSYTYDKYLICIRLGPSIVSVICKNPSYSGPSYPSSPVIMIIIIAISSYNMYQDKLTLLRYATDTKHGLRQQSLGVFLDTHTPKKHL